MNAIASDISVYEWNSENILFHVCGLGGSEIYGTFFSSCMWPRQIFWLMDDSATNITENNKALTATKFIKYCI
jgi:hypothetical protein